MLVTPRLDGSHRETELNLDDRRRVSFLREHSKDRNAGDRMEGLEKGRPARRKSDTPCYAGQTGAYIGPTGEVHPCLDWLVDCGNVRHTPFAKIWKESEGMLFARGFKLGAMKKCMECGMVGSCSICPGLNDQENRDPAIPSVLVCARARAAFQVGKGLKK
jgi:radical SAM protein with 4Fe4S-binding SPASM domain